MMLRDILHAKGTLVHTIRSDATLADVVQTLVKHNCGSLVVCDSHCDQTERLAGIITERDILKACAARTAPLEAITVAEVMTREMVVGSPHDSVEDAMGLMTVRRIRHLPVVEDGQLRGLVSIGDVVKMQHDRLTMENHYLKSYLHG
jgi:CBS domain-containing protein